VLEFAGGGDLLAAGLPGHRQDGEPLDLLDPGKRAVPRFHGRAVRGEDGGVIGQDGGRRVAEAVSRPEERGRVGVEHDQRGQGGRRSPTATAWAIRGLAASTALSMLAGEMFLPAALVISEADRG
jgi:hypothetical protein